MFTSNKFELGQIVYLKTDPKQKKRIIDGLIDYGYTVDYCLSLRGAKNNESIWYKSFQISAKKNIGEK